MNNKNILLILASLLVVAIKFGYKDKKASSVVKVTESVVSPLSAVMEKEMPLVVDSIGKSFSSNKGNLDFAYDFPISGPSPLVDSLRAYLSSVMADAVMVYNEEDRRVSPYGNPADGKGMITYYATAAFKSLTQLFEDDGDTDNPRIPELSMSVMKAGETERFVTYVSSFYLYSGGAHGMDQECGVTFDKKSGVRLQNVLKEKSEKALQPILKEGVENYFRETVEFDDRKVTEAELREFMDGLFLEKGVFPLPGNGLYLSPEGVVFSYGQYEIGAYAIGMPTFTVPYRKIEKFLTPEACRLAGIK